jgi:uncharacterized membrane protein YedE/YeeE
MPFFYYLIVGALFGVTMAQSEAASWYRIQEMFRFQSFHMYGIIGVAVVLGALATWLIKRAKIRDFQGNSLVFGDKQKSFSRYFFGGSVFGLGWALGGACPGPMMVLVGQGWFALLAVITGAVAGTWLYGLVRHKLPH